MKKAETLEELLLYKIAEIWNMFLTLEEQHPDEKNDFKEGIHKCQAVLGMRFAREYKPDLFPKHKEMEE